MNKEGIYSWRKRHEILTSSVGVLDFVSDRLEMLQTSERDFHKSLELKALRKLIDGLYGELYIVSRTSFCDWSELKERQEEGE